MAPKTEVRFLSSQTHMISIFSQETPIPLIIEGVVLLCKD
jgi:hypothetical protein